MKETQHPNYLMLQELKIERTKLLLPLALTYLSSNVFRESCRKTLVYTQGPEAGGSKLQGQLEKYSKALSKKHLRGTLGWRCELPVYFRNQRVTLSLSSS